MKSIFTKLLREREKGNDTVLVTIVSGQGSAPRGVGAMMLVGRQGRLLGSIGGGAIEKHCETLAQMLLGERRSLLHVFQLRAGEALGMVCGGEAGVLLQFVSAEDARWDQVIRGGLDRMERREPGFLSLSIEGAALTERAGEGLICLPLTIGERAILFGGGHIALALSPLLKTVGFRTVIFDDRAEYADPARFPEAELCICGDYQRIADSLPVEPEDYIVVMTSGHSHDMEVQAQVLRRETAYVGVIGSRAKIAAVNAKLRERGIPEAVLAGVHTPIGIPILAVTPAEIAVSIAGEMILVRAQRRKGDSSAPRSCPMHNFG